MYLIEREHNRPGQSEDQWREEIATGSDWHQLVPRIKAERRLIFDDVLHRTPYDD